MGLLLKFADNYGRKKLMFVGCLYHLLLILAILFSDDYRAYYVILFFGGISFAKETLIYVYTLEMTPKKYQVYVGGYVIL